MNPDHVPRKKNTMTRKQRRLVFGVLALLLQSGRCAEADEPTLLANGLRAAREESATFFSGAFTAVTVFSCLATETARLKLLRRLARIFAQSSVLDLNARLEDLAWAKGHRGQHLQVDAHRQLFVLDLNCPDVKGFLLKANQEMMFAAPFKWLMFKRTSETADSLHAAFAQLGLYPDSSVTIWQWDTGQLYSVYKTNSGSSSAVEDRGLWIPEKNEMVIRDRHASSRRRRNLMGTQLKSCLVITHPDTVNHLTDYQDRHIDSITKCNYPWALHLVNMMNATVTFEQANTWGYQSPNGSWGGMIGMLQRGEIDFGGTGTFLLRERIGVVQYISLSTPTGSRFIFRRPPLSSVSNLFKLPFRGSVWLSICVLVILLVIALYPAMRLEWKQSGLWERMHEPQPPDLSDDLLVIVGAVSQQGSWYEPRSLPTRIVVLMALLAALNLYAAYTANIVALLQSTTTSINSLKDLLNSPLTLAAHDNVFNRYYFKSFKDPVRQSIFEERIEPKGAKKTNWMAIEDGIENMRRGYFAFHVEPGCAYKIVQETFEEDEKCGFHEIDYLNVFDPHFIVKRRSPYLELLRVGALRLHESGLRTRELGRLYTKKPVCGSANRFLSVGLTECYGAFVTLLFGALLAFGFFVIEKLSVRVRIPAAICKSGRRSVNSSLGVSENAATPPGR